ncbi:unnamed protein product [marine sediment metagenome]|uniref:3-dehydroquinate dehydratase n=1 Tax=marine sediment metagenome TaxID=412755 RepID=X1K7X3_9ZZZZ
MKHILVIHGPNLNLLGRREIDIYGKVTLAEINEAIKQKAKELDCQVKIKQSNSEGEVVSFIGVAKIQDLPSSFFFSLIFLNYYRFYSH